MKHLFIIFAVLLAMGAQAQKVNPKAYYIDKDQVSQETTNIEDGEAPLDVTFRANPSEMDEYTPSYEWHFRHTNLNGEGVYKELFVRYEEDTQYRFTESGTYHVVLKVRLEQDGAELDCDSITITISQSKLEFPNAFSPNDDGYNDIFGAKGVIEPQSTEHWKNIVKFDAYIFNRWGQKLYEWHDPAGFWDGKFHGRYVNDGVYFLLCKAKGSDGREYNIRKDINVLRGHSGEKGSNTNDSDTQ